MPLMLILSCAAFVSAFSIRMIDPLVPAIARDFSIPIETAALLASAFTFPYALSQPILGPLGDAAGKERIIKICLGVLTLALVVATLASQLEFLFLARMIAGIAGGGIIPIAFAIIGDRFEMQERQVALSRMIMASQISILMGSLGGGFVAANYGWRWMFGVPAVFVLVVLLLALRNLKSPPGEIRQPLSIARTRASYLEALKSPYAAICLIGVFIGGCTMFGLTPFIAGRLERLQMGGLRESGMIIGAMSIGGIIFTLLVRQLLARLGRVGLVRLGGAILSTALILYAFATNWQQQALLFGFIGMGFFMMHNCLQALGVELAPKARASGISLMAFVFFLGQAAGPVVYSFAFSASGQRAPIVAAGVIFALLSLWVSIRLSRLDRLPNAPQA
ncbi:MAG: MFS transporter [Hyphomicrobiaceae bacterium]|nr:MFS transporter [Hyphomicrobiaceae bacterium]